MKICLNQRIQYLSESFHKGQLTLTDYRELRREELEHLKSKSQTPQSVVRKAWPKTRCSPMLARKVVGSTLLAISLLILTVLLVRLL